MSNVPTGSRYDKVIELYGGKVKIGFYERGHAYWRFDTPKRTRLTGVTTFTGILDKSRALMGYAADQAIDYVEENLEVLQNDPARAHGVLIEARGKHTEFTEEAATVGSAVHDWIDQFVLGEKPSMPTDPNVLVGVNAFMEWVDRHDVNFVASEQMVYSKKNNYVGTLDAKMRFGNGRKTYLGDYKVSNGLYAPVKMQTAAYLKADEEESGQSYAGRYAIRISKETEEEYWERMERKNELRSAKGMRTFEPKPYKPFEAVFLDDNPEELERDFQGFINAMGLQRWNKVADKAFF